MKLSLFSAPLAASILLGGLLFCGCDRSSKAAHSGPLRSGDSHGDLIKSVASSINHLEEFDSNEMSRQVCDQLNQWVLNEHPEVDWRRDPLVDTLPAEFRGLEEVKQLDSSTYTPTDVAFLQESIWLRDIAKRTQAGAFDDLETAERLFDWTVRNLQLAAEAEDPARRVYHAPRETLLTSRATAQERALYLRCWRDNPA